MQDLGYGKQGAVAPVAVRSLWERSRGWPVIGHVLFAFTLLLPIGVLLHLALKPEGRFIGSPAIATSEPVALRSASSHMDSPVLTSAEPVADANMSASGLGTQVPSASTEVPSPPVATAPMASTLSPADSMVPIAVVVSATTASPSMLDSLVVAMLDNSASYRRDAFGPDWIDADRDCHNTRAEVLMQETAAPVTFNPNGCTVATGQWTDPWSGFTSTLASDFQIDHLVPLANAWRSGAAGWDGSRREAFAQNLDEPDELNALHGPVNTAKSDKTPDQWKPPLEQSWCRYATAWIRIKATWGLTVTAREKSALASMLERC